MSGHLLNTFKKKESDDLTNLLHTLHVSLVIDATRIKEIAKYTSNDPILNDLSELIKPGKNYITKRKLTVVHNLDKMV